MNNVAVVGASPKANRYSHMAMKLLEEFGYNPIPVAPAKQEVLGKKAYPSLALVPDLVDTVTMYVGPSQQALVLEDVIRMKPRRIIFNPGTENPDEYKRLKAAGIEVVEACTLILLRTKQF